MGGARTLVRAIPITSPAARPLMMGIARTDLAQTRDRSGSTYRTIRLRFGADRPRHQCLGRLVHAGLTAEDVDDGAGNRQLDGFLLRHLEQDRGGEDAFGELGAGLSR